GGEVLGRLDARDGVVRLAGFVVLPAFDPEGNLRHGAPGCERGLRRTEGDPDTRRGTVNAHQPVEHGAPAAADVQHSRALDLQAFGEEVELALLCTREGLGPFMGLPPRTGVDEVVAEA